MKNNRKNNNEFENTAGIITLEHYNILRQECNDMKERLAVLRKNKRGEQVIDTSSISQAEVVYNCSLSLEETSQHEIDFLENFLSRVKVVTE